MTRWKLLGRSEQEIRGLYLSDLRGVKLRNAVHIDHSIAFILDISSLRVDRHRDCGRQSR